MYFPARRPYEFLVLTVLLVSLWATVTNAVPLSVAFAVLVPLVPFALSRTDSVPRVVVALLCVYAYFGISTLVYAPSSFLAPAFYRRDGNFFVTYLPVLIGGLMTLRIDMERLLVPFLTWVTALNAVLMAVYVVTGGTVVYFEAGVYHSLFEAHNAAGGFLTMMTAMSMGFLLTSRRKFWPLVAVLINAMGAVLTVSRGSLLGLFVAFLLVAVLRGRFVLTAVVMSVVVMIGVMSYVYPLWLDAGSPASLWLDGSDAVSSAALAGADANTADRLLFLWPRALDLFLQSPIFGAGFGSYNDLPYTMIGLPHFVAMNSGAPLVFSSSHAHNSYLHVLAECGLVGLLLVILFLRESWKAIQHFSPPIRQGMAMAFLVAVFSSFTEHRLFTPAQMLPFTIILGLALANRRWELRNEPIACGVTA